jgi:hypothetical protein
MDHDVGCPDSVLPRRSHLGPVFWTSDAEVVRTAGLDSLVRRTAERWAPVPLHVAPGVRAVHSCQHATGAVHAQSLLSTLRRRSCSAGIGRYARPRPCLNARSARLARAHCWQWAAQMLCWTCTLGIQIFLPLTVLGIGVGDRPSLPRHARPPVINTLTPPSLPSAGHMRAAAMIATNSRSAALSVRARARSAADQPPGRAARVWRQRAAAAAGAGLSL